MPPAPTPQSADPYILSLQRCARCVVQELPIFECLFDAALASAWKIGNATMELLARLLMLCVGCSVEFDMQMHCGQYQCHPPIGTSAHWRTLLSSLNALLQQAVVLQEYAERGKAPSTALDVATLNRAGYYFLALLDRDRTVLWEDNVTRGLKDRRSTQVTRICEAGAPAETKELLAKLGTLLYKEYQAAASTKQGYIYQSDNSVHSPLFETFHQLSATAVVSHNEVMKFGCRMLRALPLATAATQKRDHHGRRGNEGDSLHSSHGGSLYGSEGRSQGHNNGHSSGEGGHVRPRKSTAKINDRSHMIKESVLSLILTPNRFIKEQFTDNSLFFQVAVAMRASRRIVVAAAATAQPRPYLSLHTAIAGNMNNLQHLLFVATNEQGTIRIRLGKLVPHSAWMLETQQPAPWMCTSDEETGDQILISRDAEGILLYIQA